MTVFNCHFLFINLCELHTILNHGDSYFKLYIHIFINKKSKHLIKCSTKVQYSLFPIFYLYPTKKIIPIHFTKLKFIIFIAISLNFYTLSTIIPFTFTFTFTFIFILHFLFYFLFAFSLYFYHVHFYFIFYVLYLFFKNKKNFHFHFYFLQHK